MAPLPLRSRSPAAVSTDPATSGRERRAHGPGQAHQADRREQRASTDPPAEPPGTGGPREPRRAIRAGRTGEWAPRHLVLAMRSRSHRSLPRLGSALRVLNATLPRSSGRVTAWPGCTDLPI